MSKWLKISHTFLLKINESKQVIRMESPNGHFERICRAKKAKLHFGSECKNARKSNFPFIARMFHEE